MFLPACSRLPACLLAVALFGVVFAGCEESFDPFVGEERPYTLWGYMDTGSDTQFVRVFTIEDRLGLDRSGPIDAEVFSTDLTTGEQRQWRDSVIVFEGLGEGHVFWSDFTAQHEHRYRLEVIRSDGATSSVEVTTPPAASLEIDPNTTSTIIPANIHGDVPNIVGAEVVYRVVPAYPGLPWEGGFGVPPPVILPAAVSYSREVKPAPGGWAFEVDLEEDYALVKAELERNCMPVGVIMRDMEVRLLAADSSWKAPGGVFDPEILIEPNAFTNVENGFGFFGAGQTLSHTWTPHGDARTNSGFVLQGPCQMSSNPDCLITTWPCFRCEEPLTQQIRQVYCRTPPLTPQPLP